ncbi:Coatomer subunit beta-2 [Babesia sp. Xinjiang]|uniref:Coatomer subunit beta-2 n=1 Tax=Babesia sp. Xinjiang TaxID=462227 RepID=UPI000A2202BF|nr:Coatomer subunit beta-2 [Babesia sp. Xinjiang]ORM39546.1 Coatomer subunit beta-2 [Babesia sp. Xinjiang]
MCVNYTAVIMTYFLLGRNAHHYGPSSIVPLKNIMDQSDIHTIASDIQECGYRRIAIQSSDVSAAARYCTALQEHFRSAEVAKEFYVLGDVFIGSCCTDVIAARRCAAVYDTPFHYFVDIIEGFVREIGKPGYIAECRDRIGAPSDQAAGVDLFCGRHVFACSSGSERKYVSTNELFIGDSSTLVLFLDTGCEHGTTVDYIALSSTGSQLHVVTVDNGSMRHSVMDNRGDALSLRRYHKVEKVQAASTIGILVIARTLRGSTTLRRSLSRVIERHEEIARRIVFPFELLVALGCIEWSNSYEFDFLKLVEHIPVEESVTTSLSTGEIRRLQGDGEIQGLRRHKKRGRGKKSSARGYRFKRQKHRGSKANSRTFEGGQTPLFKRLPKWPEAWLSSKCVKVKRGVQLFNVNDYPFPYKIDIEVAGSDQSSIDAIKRVGGSVTIVYYDRVNLRAHLKPYKFEARPSIDKVHYLEKMRARGCNVVYIKPMWLIKEEQAIAAEMAELEAETLTSSELDPHGIMAVGKVCSDSEAPCPIFLDLDCTSDRTLAWIKTKLEDTNNTKKVTALEHTILHGNVREESILVCNALRNDLCSPNEYVRGSTLRLISKLRHWNIVSPMITAVVDNLKHSDPYVHRNALMCLAKIAERFGTDCVMSGLEDTENLLLGDSGVSVKVQAFNLLRVCQPALAVQYLMNVEGMLLTLPPRLHMEILSAFLSLCSLNSEVRSFMMRVAVTLMENSQDNSVRVEGANIICHLKSTPIEARRAAAGAYIKVLLDESDLNVKMLVLEKLNTLHARSSSLGDVPNVLEAHVMDIVHALNGSSREVSLGLLSLALRSLTRQNVESLLQSFKKAFTTAEDIATYSQQQIAEYRIMLIKAIHYTCGRYPERSGIVYDMLLGYLSHQHQQTAEDCALFFKQLTELLPQLREETIVKLLTYLEMIPHSNVLSVCFWVIGEYAESSQLASHCCNHIYDILSPYPFVAPNCLTESSHSFASSEFSSEEFETTVTTQTVVLQDGTYGAQLAGDAQRAPVEDTLRDILLKDCDPLLYCSVAQCLLKLCFTSGDDDCIAKAALVTANLIRLMQDPQYADVYSQRRLRLIMKLCIGFLKNREEFRPLLDEYISTSRKKWSSTPLSATIELKGDIEEPISYASIFGGMVEDDWALDEESDEGELTSVEDFEIDKVLNTTAAIHVVGVKDHDKRDLGNIHQFTSLMDPVYIEATISVIATRMYLTLYLRNTTEFLLQNIRVELCSNERLEISSITPIITLESGGSSVVHVNFKMKRSQNDVLYGHVYFDKEKSGIQECLPFNPMGVCLYDYVLPSFISSELFRTYWADFEWEHKIHIQPVKVIPLELLRNVLQVTHMTVVGTMPPSGFKSAPGPSGQKEFLSQYMEYLSRLPELAAVLGDASFFALNLFCRTPHDTVAVSVQLYRNMGFLSVNFTDRAALRSARYKMNTGDLERSKFMSSVAEATSEQVGQLLASECGLILRCFSKVDYRNYDLQHALIERILRRGQKFSPYASVSALNTLAEGLSNGTTTLWSTNESDSKRLLSRLLSQLHGNLDKFNLRTLARLTNTLSRLPCDVNSVLTAVRDTLFELHVPENNRQSWSEEVVHFFANGFSRKGLLDKPLFDLLRDRITESCAGYSVDTLVSLSNAYSKFGSAEDAGYIDLFTCLADEIVAQRRQLTNRHVLDETFVFAIDAYDGRQIAMMIHAFNKLGYRSQNHHFIWRKCTDGLSMVFHAYTKGELRDDNTTARFCQRLEYLFNKLEKSDSRMASSPDLPQPTTYVSLVYSLVKGNILNCKGYEPDEVANLTLAFSKIYNNASPEREDGDEELWILSREMAKVIEALGDCAFPQSAHVVLGLIKRNLLILDRLSYTHITAIIRAMSTMGIHDEDVLSVLNSLKHNKRVRHTSAVPGT